MGSVLTLRKNLIVPIIAAIILMGASISWSEPDALATAVAGTMVSFDDTDGDGIPNTGDNCVTTPNVLQRDTDSDGIGNYCDADLSNDCTINFIDLGMMWSVFDGFDPHADMNGDGVVNNADLDISRLSFFGAPGPSGLPNACAPPPQNPRVMYPGPYTFGMGERSTSVAIADLNADAAPDLVTTYAESDSVAVLLGNGDGSFQTPRTFGVGEKPLYVAIADLNADGVPDLATANSMSHDVSVLLGNGDGNFQPTVTIRVGSLPTTIAIADLNADERPDLVTANRWSDDVSVLLGNGDGSFQTPVAFYADDQASSVDIADLNADGVPDLVATSKSRHSVAVLLGNGDGSFQAPVRFAAGHTPRTVVIADFNGDSVPDLAIANNNGSSPRDQYVSVLLGNGDGSFQTAVRIPVGDTPTSLATTDFNTDGVLDLVTANHGSNDVSILLGNGDGSFQTALTLGASIGARLRPISVAVADVNADDAPDVVTVTRFSADVFVWLGNGDGSFQTAQRFGVGAAPRSVVIADLNADDAPDLVTADPWSDEVSVLLGNGVGSFQTRLAFAVGDQPRSVAIADLNADDAPDLVTANFMSDDISVLLGNGDGSFQTPLEFGVGEGPGFVAIADLNADDAPDLVIAKISSSNVSVLLGNGDGSFQTAFQTPGESGSVAIADLNTDGIPDLITRYRVRLGNGDGSFQPPLATGASNVRSIAVADVNADGIPDLATANAVNGGSPDAGVVSIQLGNGDGTFQTPHAFDAGRGPVSVAIADLNADGIPDLITGNVPYDDLYTSTGYAFSGAVTVLLGNGDGTVQAPLAFAVGSGPIGTAMYLAIGDLNADGMPDLVAANSNSDYLSVLLHQWTLPLAK